MTVPALIEESRRASACSGLEHFLKGASKSLIKEGETVRSDLRQSVGNIRLIAVVEIIVLESR